MGGGGSVCFRLASEAGASPAPEPKGTDGHCRGSRPSWGGGACGEMGWACAGLRGPRPAGSLRLAEGTGAPLGRLSQRALSEVKLAQSCPTLCDPMDCSPPGSSVHGVLQARTLEWAAIPISRGSSPPRGQARGSCMAGGFFTACPYCPHIRHPAPHSPSPAAGFSGPDTQGQALGCGPSSLPGPPRPHPRWHHPRAPLATWPACPSTVPATRRGPPARTHIVPQALPSRAERRAPGGEVLVRAQSPGSPGQVLAG